MTPLELPDLIQADMPRADSRWIAQQIGNEHRHLIRLITDYQADFEEFGVLRFENEKPLEGSLGGRPSRFALLNEDQSYLLLTYVRNSPQARECKRALVKAFAKARQQLERNHPPIPPGLPDFTVPSIAARAWADQFEAREKLELDLEQSRPKIQAHDQLMDAEGLYSVREAAKLLGTGQNRLFAWLRAQQVFMQHNEPYQRFVERGLFEVKTLSYFDERLQNEHLYVKSFVTPKGLVWLREKLAGQKAALPQ